MFKYLVRGLLAGVAFKLLDQYRLLSLRRLQIEAATGYLKGVRLARRSALGLLRMGLMIALIVVGALLIHVGLFILLPWTLEAKALLGIGLGVADMLIGGVALQTAMTEKSWLAAAGADEILKDVSGHPQQE